MKAATRPTVARQLEIPEAIRALDVLPSSYVDVFVVTTPLATKVSPERWARETLEGASAAGRFMAWRIALSLRLNPRPSPDRLAGWEIVDRSDGSIRIEASSWYLTANMAFHVEGDQVSMATFIRYDNPLARLVWMPVSAIHRQLGPKILYAAARRIERNR